MSPLLPSGRVRWAVPLGIVAVVAGALGVRPIVAGAAPSLPPKTAAELLASVGTAGETPLSGTIVETAKLGLPALPDTGNDPTSLQSLVTGSHTARLWYAGPDKARFALLGNLAETDVVRNGPDVWLWTSSTNTAQHATLPKNASTRERAPQTPMSPQEAARRALAAVDPTTAVSVDGAAQVAGRSAYELVLRPRDTRSLVGQVRLAVDSKTYAPLRVQVFAKGAGSPAFQTGFTSVRFTTPADSVFRFTPPPGAKVKRLALPAGGRAAAHERSGAATAGPSGWGTPEGGPTVIGKGWTAVVVAHGVDLGGRENAQLEALLRASTPVSGSFGSGRLLQTKLFSALLLDDGRALVGAVSPSMLEQVAGTAAARAGTGTGS
jgi:outer membrane lipoprotein-sorting protein